MELVDVLNSRKELTGEVCERNMVQKMDIDYLFTYGL